MNFEIFPPVENLTLDNFDTFIRKIREDGREPNGIVVHFKQYGELQGILNAQMRYMEFTCMPQGYNLTTYQGIPIFPTHFNKGYRCQACGDGAQGAILNDSRILFYCKYHHNRVQMFTKMEVI